MAIITVDDNWLPGRLTWTLNSVEKEAGKEQKAGAGTTDDEQKICDFYVREQRAEGGCAFMDKFRRHERVLQL